MMDANEIARAGRTAAVIVVAIVLGLCAIFMALGFWIHAAATAPDPPLPTPAAECDAPAEPTPAPPPRERSIVVEPEPAGHCPQCDLQSVPGCGSGVDGPYRRTPGPEDGPAR